MKISCLCATYNRYRRGSLVEEAVRIPSYAQIIPTKS